MGKSVRKVQGSFFEDDSISSKVVDASFFEDGSPTPADQPAAEESRRFDFRQGQPYSGQRSMNLGNGTAPVAKPVGSWKEIFTKPPAPKPTPSFDTSPFSDVNSPFGGEKPAFAQGPANDFERARKELEDDVMLDLSFSLTGINQTAPQNPNEFSIAKPAAPRSLADGRAFTPEEYKEVKKNIILSDPEELGAFRLKRMREIDTLIDDTPDDVIMSGGTGGAGFDSRRIVHTPNADRKRELEERKKKFNDNLSKVAQVAVPESVFKQSVEDGVPVDFTKAGELFKRITGTPGYKDDKNILDDLVQNESVKVNRMTGKETDIDDFKYDQERSQKTKQAIQYDFEKTGADLFTNYFALQMEDIRRRDPLKIDLALSVIDGLNNAKTPDEFNQYQTQWNEVMKDPTTAAFAEAAIASHNYGEQAEGLINKYPQVKRKEQRQKLNNAFFALKSDERENLFLQQSPSSLLENALPTFASFWESIVGAKAEESDISELSKKTGIPVADVKRIVEEGGRWNGYSVKTVGLLGGVAQGIEETSKKMAMGVKRIVNSKDVNTINRLSSDALSERMMMASQNKLIDETGQWNVNPNSIMQQMGYGVGQTAMYALPTLLTGGLAGEAAALKKITEASTTIASAMAGSAEDAYQEAARYTDDESVRRGYMFVTALENAAPELILSPADVIKKINGKAFTKPTGAGVESTFKTFANEVGEKGLDLTIKQRTLAFAKNFGNVVLAENIEEQLTNFSNNATKEQMLGVKMGGADISNQAFETFVLTTLTTLPLGIGAGIGGSRDASGVRKQAYFEAGNEPQLYGAKLKELRDNGTITEQQFNEKISVLNTMHDIVGKLPATNKNGRELTYEEKSNLAAQQFRIEWNKKRLEKTPINAEKKIIEEDNVEAEKVQEEILNTEEVDNPINDNTKTVSNFEQQKTNPDGNSKENRTEESGEGSSQEGSAQEGGSTQEGSKEISSSENSQSGQAAAGTVITSPEGVAESNPAAPLNDSGIKAENVSPVNGNQNAESNSAGASAGVEENEQPIASRNNTGVDSGTRTGDAGVAGQAPAVSVAPKEGDTVSLPSSIGGENVYTFNDGQWQYKDSRDKWNKLAPKEREKVEARWNEAGGTAGAAIAQPVAPAIDLGEGVTVEKTQEEIEEEEFEKLNPEEREIFLALLKEDEDAAIEMLRPKEAAQEEAATTTTQTQAAPGVSVSETEGIAALTEKYKGNKRASGVISQATKAINTLKSVLPDFDIVVHDTEEGYNDAVKGVGGLAGSSGNFSYKRTNGNYRGRIDINLSKAGSRTVAHEVTHGILLKAFGDNAQLFSEFRKAISKAVSAGDNARIKDFVSMYEKNERPEEYLAELSAIMASEGKSLKPTTLQKIADVINSFVFKITGGKLKPFSNVHAGKSLIEFFNSMSNAIAQGEAFSIEEEQASAEQEEVASKSQLVAEVKELFQTRDGKPIGFEYDTDKVARERFDFSELEQIGKGSDRTVFDLGDGRVLKVAHTARGLEQNIHEGDWYLVKAGVLPEMYERGLNYVVVDNTPRLKGNDIVPTYDVETGEVNGETTATRMIKELKKFYQPDFNTKKQSLQDVFEKYGFADVLSYDILYDDFSSLRNWGYKNGSPVHLDGGTFMHVNTLRSFDLKPNLSDPEFREIYNISRQIKREQGDTDVYSKFQMSAEERQSNHRKADISFFEGLKKHINGDSAMGEVLPVGYPSEELLSVLPDLPIEFQTSQLGIKQKSHNLTLSQIMSLPDEMRKPVAVFRSKTTVGSMVLMLEIESDGQPMVVIVAQDKQGKGGSRINDVRSFYSKKPEQIFKWIAEDGLLEYADKNKFLNWLDKQQSNSVEVAKLVKEASKIVNGLGETKSKSQKAEDTPVRSKSAAATKKDKKATFESVKNRLRRFHKKGLLTDEQYRNALRDVLKQSGLTSDEALNDEEREEYERLFEEVKQETNKNAQTIKQRIERWVIPTTGDTSEYSANKTFSEAGLGNTGRPPHGDTTSIGLMTQSGIELITKLKEEDENAIEAIMQHFGITKFGRMTAKEIESRVNGVYTPNDFKLANILLAYLNTMPLSETGVSVANKILYSKYLKNFSRALGRDMGKALNTAKIRNVMQDILADMVADSVMSSNEQRSVDEAEEALIDIVSGNVEDRPMTDEELAAVESLTEEDIEREAKALLKEERRIEDEANQSKLIKSVKKAFRRKEKLQKEISEEKSRSVVAKLKSQLKKTDAQINELFKDINCPD